MTANAERIPSLRDPQMVACECGFVIFDGEVIRARVVKFVGQGAAAKCRCKRWVPLPFIHRM